MLSRLPILGLIALVISTSTAYSGKPADLPNNPTIIFQTIPALPVSSWNEIPAQANSTTVAEGSFQLILPPVGEQMLKTALMLNVHPFLAFLPPELPIPLGCPYQPGSEADKCPAPQQIFVRSVLENLQALEKAAECGMPHSGQADSTCVRFLKQFGLCELSQFCDLVKHQEKQCAELHKALRAPMTIHCTSYPLGELLRRVSEVSCVEIRMDETVKADLPVCLNVEKAAVFTVIEKIVGPLGYQPCIEGNCIYVRAENACPKACPVSCKTQCTVVCGDEAYRKACLVTCSGDNSCVKHCCSEACCKKGCCANCTCEAKCSATAVEQPCANNCTIPGVAEQVTGLLKACYFAIEEERYEKAADLARQAFALDPARVLGDPIIYKFNLLQTPKTNCNSCPATQRHTHIPNSQTHSCRMDAKPIVVQTGETEPCQQGASKTVQVKPGSIRIAVKVSSNSCPVGCGNCPKSGCQSATESGCSLTKFLQTHGWECVSQVGNFLWAVNNMSLPPKYEGKGCITVGLSTTGKINLFFRSRPYQGQVTEAMFKDGFFLIWTKPVVSIEIDD